jgi:hypothetical protein
MPEDFLALASLFARDVDAADKAGAQEVGEDARVDLIGLDLGLAMMRVLKGLARVMWAPGMLCSNTS